MSYNLLVWLQHPLHIDFGIADDKVARKFDAYLAQRTCLAEAQSRRVHPLLFTTLPRRMAQISAQFIRCVRNLLFAPNPLADLLPAFRAAQCPYL